MEFTTVDLKRCTLVRLSGRIDGSVAPSWATTARPDGSGRYKIVLNMKDVN